MKVDVDIESNRGSSFRAKQVSAAFDVPVVQSEMLRWHGDFSLPEDWKVGLIVGPSGAGKSTILESSFGVEKKLRWCGDAVVDDFPSGMSIEEIVAVCQAVGFNTIPAWLRPYGVLSNGEKFRVELARRFAESKYRLVLDEFTSVVDRQVAQIASHAAQKWVRRNNRQLVVATCHYDVEPWLQPDWILEPATMTFRVRSECLQRPKLKCCVQQVDYSTWRLFAPFHYLTAELKKQAKCFVLFAGENEEPAAFAGVLHRPHPQVKNIRGVSRLVTLPDWQGLGLAFALVDRLGAENTRDGYYLHTYPAHPALMKSFARSDAWRLLSRPSIRGRKVSGSMSMRTQGERPCATFRYVGPAAS